MVFVDTDRAQSEFNMDISYLNRLNTLLYAANEAAINLDMNSWFYILQALHRELSSEMKEEELIIWGNGQTGKIGEINDMLLKHGGNIRQGVSKSLYSKLHDFEIFLRRVLKKAGLQGKKKDDPRQALQ